MEKRQTCPKCGQAYDHLKAFCLEENRYELGLGDDDKLEWSTSDPVEGSCVKIELECPHYEQVIYAVEVRRQKRLASQDSENRNLRDNVVRHLVNFLKVPRGTVFRCSKL